MKTFLATIACMSFAATAAMADTHFFHGIVSDAAKIERDASAIRDMLKAKNFNVDEVRKNADTLGASIATLREDVEKFESTNPEMTEAQKRDWELLKTKAQLLTIYHGQKSELLSSEDVVKKRSLLRAHAKGIAERAALLQKTASRLGK